MKIDRYTLIVLVSFSAGRNGDTYRYTRGRDRSEKRKKKVISQQFDTAIALRTGRMDTVTYVVPTDGKVMSDYKLPIL
eukprot:440179-Prorocentrum_minimum.AAC.2